MARMNRLQCLEDRGLSSLNTLRKCKLCRLRSAFQFRLRGVSCAGFILKRPYHDPMVHSLSQCQITCLAARMMNLESLREVRLPNQLQKSLTSQDQLDTRLPVSTSTHHHQDSKNNFPQTGFNIQLDRCSRRKPLSP